MRIHSLQHERFEGLGNIEVWAKNKGYNISRTLLYNNEGLPGVNEMNKPLDLILDNMEREFAPLE